MRGHCYLSTWIDRLINESKHTWCLCQAQAAHSAVQPRPFTTQPCAVFAAKKSDVAPPTTAKPVKQARVSVKEKPELTTPAPEVKQEAKVEAGKKTTKKVTKAKPKAKPDKNVADPAPAKEVKPKKTKAKKVVDTPKDVAEASAAKVAAAKEAAAKEAAAKEAAAKEAAAKEASAKEAKARQEAGVITNSILFFLSFWLNM